MNVPGTLWLIYLPIQRVDAGPSAKLFGIGSGDGDFRLSLGYGLISIGREWNLLWLRGFWFGENDPIFQSPPSDLERDYFKSIRREAD